MPRLRLLSTEVAWAAWSADAFGRAREERKPVLLSLTAEWCGACRLMDASSFADPLIATTINERFVPIRVDADARPDIAERYTLGGWPTTAFLTADGDILGGGTFIARERLGGVLDQVLDAHARSAGRRAPRAPVPDDGVAEPVEPSALGRTVVASFDRVHGGIAGAPKFPQCAPVRLALAGTAGPARSPDDEALAVRALDAMGWRGLFDDVDGGFFRYAACEDWTAPHTAKRLDVNAALIRLYLDAGAALGQARFTDRAADALRYVQAVLADPEEGGWYAAQHADDDFYASPPAVRSGLEPPPVSRRMYADAVGLMASAALRAADVFGDAGLRQFALTSLERVLLQCYKPGDGVAHYRDGERRCRGLLADQVVMAAACLDAHDATGNIVYEMMAEELMHFAAASLWDRERGGFLDRAPGGDDAIGLLATTIRPFADNCFAAAVLHRLGASSGDREFADLATRTLEAIAPLAARHGTLAAHFLLASRGLSPV